MSNNGNELQNLVIDPCDIEDDAIPSTPGQEHLDISSHTQDSASLLGVFNGDSLESTDPPPGLEDEPIDEEEFAAEMSMEHIHRDSPLSKLRKDPSTFSVSVSDGLPPEYLMELDSPENELHDEESSHDDDDDDDIHLIGTTQSSQHNNFGTSLLSSDSDCRFRKTDVSKSSIAKKDEVSSMYSQEDIFASQDSEFQSVKPKSDSLHSPSKLLEVEETKSEELVSSQMESEIIPSTLDEKITKHISNSVSEINNKNTVRRPSYKNSSEKYFEKEESFKETSSDSDIEILESNNESIEVLYDKKEVDHSSNSKDVDSSFVGSQDFDLFLSSNTQSQIDSDICATSKVSSNTTSTYYSFENSDASQSLISRVERQDVPVNSSSMDLDGNSISLDAKEELSSASQSRLFISSSSQSNGTLSATQVECVCPPAVFTQPDVESLMKNSIKFDSNKSTKLSSDVNISLSDSQNRLENIKVDSANASNKEEDISQHISQFDTVPDSPKSASLELRMDSVSKKDFNVVETSSPSLSDKSDGISKIAIPIINTPNCEELQQSESFAAKVNKEVDKLVLPLSDEKLDESSTPTSNGCMIDCPPDGKPENKSALDPESERPSSPSTIPLALTKDISSANIFSPSINNKDDSFQSSQVYADDSDDDEKLKNISKAGDKPADSLISKKFQELKKTSTPCSSNSSSPNLSNDSHSIIAKTSMNNTPRVIQSDSNSSTPSVADTEAINDSKDSAMTVSDGDHAGFQLRGRVLIEIPAYEYYDPISMYSYYALNSNPNSLLNKNSIPGPIPISQVQVVRAASSGSGSSKMSNISTISKITSSSGYIGDKSSSGTNSSYETSKFESTRLSMSSVYTIPSPPSKSSSDEMFRPPLPVYGAHPVTMVSVGAQTDFSDIIDEPREKKPLRGRGRRRGHAGHTGNEGTATPRRRIRGIVIEESEEKVEKEQQLDNLPIDKLSTKSSKSKIEVNKASVEEEIKTTKVASKSKKSREAVVDIETPSRNVKGKKSKRSRVSESDKSPEKDKKSSSNSNLSENSDINSFVYSFLSSELKATLEAAINRPFSDEEERLFLPKKDKEIQEIEQVQFEMVIRNIREVKIEPNILTFARYLDGTYYSALILKADKGDRWFVNFNLDERRQSIRELYILPTNILPRGLRCYVRDPKSDYSNQGIVVGHTFSENIILHIVRLERGEVVTTPHSHIMLSEVVATELNKKRNSFYSLVASPGGDVSLDNIVARKRRKPHLYSPAASGGESPAKKGKAAKPDAILDSSVDTGNDSSLNKDTVKPGSTKVVTAASGSSVSEEEVAKIETPKSVRKRGRPATPKSIAKKLKSDMKKTVAQSSQSDRTASPQVLLNPVVELMQLTEVKDSPKKRGRKQGSGNSTPKKFMRVEVSDDSDDPLGPLPTDRHLFSGYTIIITTSEPKEDKKRNVVELERDHLVSQFTKGGGKIAQTFTEADILLMEDVATRKERLKGKDISQCSTLQSSEAPIRILCISNTHNRTSKYIQSLAVGIPLVKHEWIIKSCKENKCLNWSEYLLPYGYSLLMQEEMEYSVEQIGKVRDVLHGEKVFLATSKIAGFADLWQPLLIAARAHVFSRPENGNFHRVLDRRTTVVIADWTAPAEELKRASSVGVTVVSTEWFVQSLIHSFKLDYTAHPQFNYDFKRMDIKN